MDTIITYCNNIDIIITNRKPRSQHIGDDKQCELIESLKEVLNSKKGNTTILIQDVKYNNSSCNNIHKNFNEVLEVLIDLLSNESLLVDKSSIHITLFPKFNTIEDSTVKLIVKLMESHSDCVKSLIFDPNIIIGELQQYFSPKKGVMHARHQKKYISAIFGLCQQQEEEQSEPLDLSHKVKSEPMDTPCELYSNHSSSIDIAGSSGMQAQDDAPYAAVNAIGNVYYNSDYHPSFQ